MTREEIREGIAREVYAFHPYVTAKGGLSGIRKLDWEEVEDKNRHYDTVDAILKYLHDNGVVIKVESSGSPTLMPLVAVEPLVEER